MENQRELNAYFGANSQAQEARALLIAWFRSAVDLGIHDLNGWGRVVGDTVERLQANYQGETVPASRLVRDIVTVLQTSYIDDARQVLIEWNRMVVDNIHVRRYVLEELLGRLALALAPLTYWEMDELVQDVIAISADLILGEAPRKEFPVAFES